MASGLLLSHQDGRNERLGEMTTAGYIYRKYEYRFLWWAEHQKLLSRWRPRIRAKIIARIREDSEWLGLPFGFTSYEEMEATIADACKLLAQCGVSAASLTTTPVAK